VAHPLKFDGRSRSSAELPAAFHQTGVLVGYGRVSTREQNLAANRAHRGQVREVFLRLGIRQEHRTGLSSIALPVHPARRRSHRRVARPARPLAGNLVGIVGRLKRQGVGFNSLHEKLDTTTLGGISSSTSSSP
jgi:DNA invertase Pin-like site-specific DNA recombinase